MVSIGILVFQPHLINTGDIAPGATNYSAPSLGKAFGFVKTWINHHRRNPPIPPFVLDEEEGAKSTHRTLPREQRTRRMETALEDGIYMAVPDHVHVVLRLFLSSRADHLCVYAAHKEGQLECEFQCKSETTSIDAVQAKGCC